MAQFEANQKRIHITKLFFSNGRVEAEFKTKKGNSFVTDSKEDSFRRNSSVTNSKVCRQYSILISQLVRDSKKILSQKIFPVTADLRLIYQLKKAVY